MNDLDILYEFTPDSNDRLYLWLGIALTLIGFGAAWWLLNRPRTGVARTQNSILAMLLFFVALMAMSTAFFSGWSLRKQGQVTLTEQTVSLGTLDIPYQDIQKIYYKRDKSTNIFQGQAATITTFLVIERSSGATHVISEEQYPIGEIMTRIKEITKQD